MPSPVFLMPIASLMLDSFRRFQRWGGWLALPVAASAALDRTTLATLETVRGDAAAIVAENYFSAARIDADFRATMKRLAAELPAAKSAAEAALALGDTFMSFDPSIRLYTLPRQARMDYGWTWQIIGDAAYVRQVDQKSEARRRELQVGDRVLALEGVPLNRHTHRLLAYGINVLAPRQRLRVTVRTGGAEPRELVIAGTRRPVDAAARDVRGGKRAPAAGSGQLRRPEWFEGKDQVREAGDVLVWRAFGLQQDPAAVRPLLEQLRGQAHLIIDLRGRYVFRPDTILALLGGLLPGRVAVGRVEWSGRDLRLEAEGDGRFRGGVVLLTDAVTAGYAEVLAGILRLHQRAVVLGDRTMGQVRHEAVGTMVRTFTEATGTRSLSSVPGADGRNRTVLDNQVRPAAQDVQMRLIDLAETPFDPTAPLVGVRLPVGRVVLADGTDLHGVGVAPDVVVLPTGEDLAGRRDVVLARALALLGQTVTPEDAYKLFRNDWDDDEIVLDQTALY